MLRLVLPEGFAREGDPATVRRRRSRARALVDVDYKATIDDPRVVDVHILRPQEIPRYVADGLFDVGVTGRDWIEETAIDVVTLSELHYSKATARPIRVVLAVAGDSPWQSVDDLPHDVRVHTEYPELTRRYLEKHGVDAAGHALLRRHRGEDPRDRRRIVEITETGRALRAAGLRILDTILVSYTEMIANPVAYADASKRQAMDQLQTLLLGALEARGKVLVKLNVDEANLDAVIGLLPALKSPTVSKLYGEDGYAVETVVAKSDINILIPALKDHGATGILELPISKIVAVSARG